MPGSGRLLWSVLMLLAVGCQSFPSGSTALFDLRGDDRGPSAESAEPTPTLAVRRPDPSDPMTWTDDEVLRMVLNREFQDASEDEKSAWMNRLASARVEDIPQLLTQRRRQQNAVADGDPATNRDDADDNRGAQQIILTEPTQDNNRDDDSGTDREINKVIDDTSVVAADGDIDWDRIAGISSRGKSHPLLDDSAELSAPLPHSAVRDAKTASLEKAPAETVSVETMAEPAEEEGRFVANVFDVFGVGRKRTSPDDLVQTASIQPAGLSQSIEDVSLTNSEAVEEPTDLDEAKALQTVYWQEDLDKLIALLEAQASHQTPGDSLAEQDIYLRQHVALRLLYLIASRRPEALAAIPDADHEEQEYWTHMLWALSTVFDDEAMPDRSVRAAETIAQLKAAIRQIESRATLQLSQSTFCQQINGFGDFIPFERDKFDSGQAVLIYTEVRHFQSEATSDGDYRTVLRTAIEIRQDSVNGPVVFRNELAETEDRCLSRRQDYFHSYRIPLPTSLKAGPHVLTLKVTDVLTGKTGTSTLNFVVK